MDMRLVILKDGMTYLNLNILLVAVAAIMAPWLAALSAAVAVLAGCSVQVQRGARY